MTVSLEITGNIQNRFIQAAVLLHLLDPVRGEPTEHGLDQNVHELQPQQERILKRKFLDSFSLVCATKKDGDTVSAASIEEGFPEGTVIRIASNHGVAESTLRALRELVAVLNDVASRVSSPSDKEKEVLVRVISLDISRIRHYLKDLRGIHALLESSSSSLKAKTAGALRSPPSKSAIASFPAWVRRASVMNDLPPDPSPDSLVTVILWALEAKRTYLACLQTVFSNDRESQPRGVRSILKLARYAIASIALLQLASDVPRLFNPMLVEPVSAPPRTTFAITKAELPLKSVLRRLAGGREMDYATRLASVWNVTDPETHFRSACSLNLPVHAEMQLLNFYDQHPERRPAFRFIGLSKKSCFLCQRFLATHPQSLSISSCHQKLYLAWRAPPTTSVTVYKQYKSIITKLSILMEAAAKQELDGRIGRRRPIPPDSSTGGVSLSGLVGFSGASGSAQNSSTMIQGKGDPEVSRPRKTPRTALTKPIEVVDLTPKEDEMHDAFSDTVPEKTILPVDQMIFHVVRPGDINRQDIIALGDVYDDHSQSPSWIKLLKVLENESGVAFKETEEFLMVNDRIRVANQRQFLACIQYLRNAMLWNSDVFVYDHKSPSSAPSDG